jgi:hypothetical protein
MPPLAPSTNAQFVFFILAQLHQRNLNNAACQLPKKKFDVDILQKIDTSHLQSAE